MPPERKYKLWFCLKEGFGSLFIHNVLRKEVLGTEPSHISSILLRKFRSGNLFQLLMAGILLLGCWSPSWCLRTWGFLPKMSDMVAASPLN